MTRLWPQCAACVITLQVDPRGTPTAFTWQGQRHIIQRVHQGWQVDSDWWSEDGEVSRQYLAVTTKGGLLCVLYQDCLDQKWYIAKLYD